MLNGLCFGVLTKGSGEEGKWWEVVTKGSGVAAADDERYLLCAAVAAAVGLPFFSTAL